MMEAFVTQMEQKQSPPSTGDFPPPPETKPPKFNTTMEALTQAIKKRKHSAGGKWTMNAKPYKAFMQQSLQLLLRVINATGALGYLEPILRQVMQLPCKKKGLSRTEEDTRPIILEEEMMKIITSIIYGRMGEVVSESQTAYQPGRGTIESRKIVTMAISQQMERKGTMIVYKRDKWNAFGTVPHQHIPAILMQAGIDAPTAFWIQLYMQTANVIVLTHYGTSRAYHMLIGVFQGDALGPYIYILWNRHYANVVASRIKTTAIQTMDVAPITIFESKQEEYSDDVTMLATHPAALMHNLQEMDNMCPKYGVKFKTPAAEEYIYIKWNDHHHQHRSLSLPQSKYSEAKRRTIREGIVILGAQACPLATDCTAKDKMHLAAHRWEMSITTARPMAAATTYREEFASQMEYQCQTCPPTLDSLQHLDAMVSRIWRKILHCTPHAQREQLWTPELLNHLRIKRPYTLCYTALTRSQLNMMNQKRPQLRNWAITRWNQPYLHTKSDEYQLKQFFEPRDIFILHITPNPSHHPHIRYAVEEPPLSPIIEAATLLDVPVTIFTDGSEFQTKDEETTGCAIVFRVGITYWKYPYALMPGLDVDTAELIALTAATREAEKLRQHSTPVDEIVTDSQAAIALLNKQPQDIKNPLRRHIAQQKAQLWPTITWIHSHQGEQRDMLTESRRQGNNEADETAKRGAKSAIKHKRYTMPMHIPDTAVLAKHIQDGPLIRTLKQAIQHSAPWDEQRRTTPNETVLWKHLTHNPSAISLVPLMWREWKSRGLWDNEWILPHCCKQLRKGERHTCHCQQSWILEAAALDTPANLSYTEGQDSIIIHHTDQKEPWATTTWSIGNPPAYLTWAAIPRNQGASMPQDTQADILHHWERVMRRYQAEATAHLQRQKRHRQ
jgi:ribonuclease HI